MLGVTAGLDPKKLQQVISKLERQLHAFKNISETA